MIIDFHTHIVDRQWLPKKWWQWLEEYYRKGSGQIPAFRGSKDRRRINEFWDPTGEKLIRSMDQAGIDVSVVLPLDYGLLLGEPEIPIEEQNRLISEIAGKHRTRLIPFVGVDPRRPNAVEILVYGIKELGMKGLKLHPAAGFHLEDNDSMILLEKAAEFDVPVIVHTGQAFGPLLSKHCQPTGVDEVLARLPGIRLIAAHMGGGWFEELCWTGYVKRNLYTDISLWQIRCRQNFKDFAGFIRKALDMLGIDHVLFGTDWPFTASVINPKAYVQAIEQFANTPAVNVSFAKAEIKAILGKNAAVLLKLGAGYGNQEN